jgi:curved DNA-binding protein CbpA
MSEKDALHPALVHSVWRQKVRLVHPDKNIDGKNATEQTQLLNEARLVLLSVFQDPRAKQRQEAENELIARAKDKAELEARRQLEEQEAKTNRRLEKKRLREMEKADLKAKRQAQKLCKREKKDQEKKAKREHYELTRKRRAPGTRMHRGIWGYKEGRQIEEEFRKFFRNNYVYAEGQRVFYSDMLEKFVEMRETTTELERNLFRIHTKRLLLETVPDAETSTYTNRRCFLHVCEKNE